MRRIMRMKRRQAGHWESRLKKAAVRFWQNWVKPTLVVVVVLGSLRSSVADWNDVPTGSMKPTILEGDRIVVNKLAYDLKIPFVGWEVARWGDPRRGDVVVCYSPEDGTRLVKRVVGLPGDQVEMHDNQLMINGKPAVCGPLAADTVAQIEPAEQIQHGFASETLGSRSHAIMTTPAVPARRYIAPVAVPAGHYLVLGDNRDLSRDSRWFGFVAREQIAGRAFGIAISFDRNHSYLPRWHRFGRGLD
jgi:signal peptidase I